MKTEMEQKAEIRNHIKNILSKLNQDYIRNASVIINDKLKKLFSSVTTNSISAYYPYNGEPDIMDFVRYISKYKNIKLFFPRVKKNNNHYNNQRRNAVCTDILSDTTGEAGISDSTDMEYELALISSLETDFIKGAFGIFEPKAYCNAASAAELNNMTWFVPGIAFDTSGSRLGRGKGFYDRLLKGSAGPKIGIFLECQKAEKIPAESHDVKMDIIITEKNIYNCNLNPRIQVKIKEK